MHGKNIGDFIDSLYINPEMEIEFSNKRFLISGYRNDDNKYTLRVDTIESISKNVFFFNSNSIQICVEAFEKAKIFDGKTIYEAHNEITVLYG